jgi:hypothetical protein
MRHAQRASNNTPNIRPKKTPGRETVLDTETKKVPPQTPVRNQGLPSQSANPEKCHRHHEHCAEQNGRIRGKTQGDGVVPRRKPVLPHKSAGMFAAPKVPAMPGAMDSGNGFSRTVARMRKTIAKITGPNPNPGREAAA